MEDVFRKFGATLAKLRRARGKTQEQLEHEGAAHRTYVSELEGGKKEPSLGTIVRLARSLDVSPASLLAGLSGDANGGEPGRLAEVFTAALRERRDADGVEGPGGSLDVTDTLGRVEQVLDASGISLGDFLAEATRLFFKDGNRDRRDSLEFLVAGRRSSDYLRYTPPEIADVQSLDPHLVLAAVRETNRVLELLHDMAINNGVPIFTLLGMRNLSSFVGEIFKSELCTVSGDRFAPNPHQDGYPDLMALTPEGMQYIAERTRLGQLTDKSFWSPYPFGGVEVKATCGNTPPAKKMPKPQIGDTRWPILQSAEWKAHHRKTNNLVGIYWDFIDGLPTVLAAFYRNDLTLEDWGEVITPKTVESSTTSVSIMRRGRRGEEVGVKKMALGWLVLPKDPDIRAAITHQNIFCLTESEIASDCSDEP